MAVALVIVFLLGTSRGHCDPVVGHCGLTCDFVGFFLLCLGVSAPTY